MKMVKFFLDVSYFRRIVSLIDQMHTQYFRGFILHYNITPVSSIDRDYRHNPYLSLTFFPLFTKPFITFSIIKCSTSFPNWSLHQNKCTFIFLIFIYNCYFNLQNSVYGKDGERN